MNRDQRYIRIAKACLRAVNQMTAGKQDISEEVQRVYEAIDEAFRQEFSSLEQEISLARDSLEQIAALDDNSLPIARKLATQALTQISYKGNSGPRN